MASVTKNITIEQGKTFELVLRWATDLITYKPITGITQAAPAVVTCAAHGVPDGWPVAITSVKGMTQINAEHTPPRGRDYKPATKVDTNTLSFDTINSAGYSAYISGGYVQYDTPVGLTGYTAAMAIKDRVGGTELIRLTDANGRIVIDPIGCTVTMTIAAVDTAAMTWTQGVYDLEMVSATGVVSCPLAGNVIVTPEVTT